jgi:hypothetical protein
MNTWVTATITVKNSDLNAGVDTECYHWKLHLQDDRTYYGKYGHGSCGESKIIQPNEKYNFTVKFYIFESDVDISNAHIEYKSDSYSMFWLHNDIL